MIRNDFILDFNDIISSGFHAVFRLKEFGTPWGNFSQQSSVFPVARVVVVNRSISGVVCRLVMISASTLLVWICRFKHNFLHLHSAWTPPPSLRGLHTIFLLDAFCPQSSNLSRCSSFAHNFADQSSIGRFQAHLHSAWPLSPIWSGFHTNFPLDEFSVVRRLDIISPIDRLWDNLSICIHE